MPLSVVLAGGAIQIVDVLLEDQLASDIRIYDDSPDTHGANVLGVPVVGDCERLESDISDSLVDSAVVAVGSIAPRERLFKKYINTSLCFPNIISSKAIICNPSIGRGSNSSWCLVGPQVTLADNNYLTTATTINHVQISDLIVISVPYLLLVVLA